MSISKKNIMKFMMFIGCLFFYCSVMACECPELYESYEVVTGAQSLKEAQKLRPKQTRWDPDKGELPLGADDAMRIFHKNADRIVKWQLKKDKHDLRELILEYPSRLHVKIRKVEFENQGAKDAWRYKIYYIAVYKDERTRMNVYDGPEWDSRADPVVITLGGEVRFLYTPCDCK